MPPDCTPRATPRISNRGSESTRAEAFLNIHPVMYAAMPWHLHPARQLS